MAYFNTEHVRAESIRTSMCNDAASIMSTIATEVYSLYLPWLTTKLLRSENALQDYTAHATYFGPPSKRQEKK